MLVPNRHASSASYRYGFQGQEKDDELKGEGNSLNYQFRMHDPRVGRFFAIDPLTMSYPHYTPYSFSGNKVIAFGEIEGLEEGWVINGEKILHVEGPTEEVLNSFNTRELAAAAQSIGMKTPEMMDSYMSLMEQSKGRGLTPYVDTATLRDNSMLSQIRNNRNGNPGAMISLGILTGVKEAPMVILPEMALAKLGNVYKVWKASKIAQKTAKPLSKIDDVAGLETLDDAIRTVDVPFQGTSTKISSLSNIDDVAEFGRNISSKNLDEAIGTLENTGWINMGANESGNITTFMKMEGKKRFILKWNKAGISHSADGKPTQYWKLYKDKAVPKKVLFRGSKASNYKSGGRGETYINGN